MKLSSRHFLALGTALLILIVDIAIFKIYKPDSKWFEFLVSIAFTIGVVPFVLGVISEVGREKEKEEKFLEFARNLVETVRSGTPISRSILNVQDKDYGSLTPHIKKLANQVALGIPLKHAFKTFADDVDNKVVTRSIVLISEAEQAGGVVDTILESVARSVSEIEDVKKEQKTAVYNLVVQGYIIFVIFIIIMLVVELKILPMTIDLAGNQKGGGAVPIPGFGGSGGSERLTPKELSMPFLLLLVTQGLFSGLVIGKLSEGSIKAGIRHSAVLVCLALDVVTGTRVFFPQAVPK